MNKKLFFVAIVSLFVGLILIASGMALGGAKYLKTTNIDSISDIINGEKSNSYSNKTKELGRFSNMNLEFNYSNFAIKKSANGKNYIEYYTKDDNDYKITIENDTLKIYENRKLNNYSFVDLDGFKNLLLNGTFQKANEFTLYIADNNFNNVHISNEMGVIELDSVRADTFILNNSMGLIKIKNCEADEYEIEESMGKIELAKIKVNKSFNAMNEMGEISGGIVYDDSKYYMIDATSEMGKVFIDPKFKHSNRRNEEQINIILKTEMGKISIKAE